MGGRYEVTGFLGEGGKKKVYLAHDMTLDRDVAFGLIKAEDLDDASRERITREAQAMARLGDNPNIMPIFDLGDEDGQPYLVQPVMDGGDVEGLIAESENGRLALDDSLRIAGEICRGLDFAHDKGIIHRDLKPSNVWLTGDGAVRIGDFGLAISLDRARITQEQMMVGTVSYMPPEQATGGEITSRSDLYSLGAMLYEMVTGRPPFFGDDEIAIIGQHINTPPVSPSWHNQSLPQTLDSLIMRLFSGMSVGKPMADYLRVQADLNGVLHDVITVEITETAAMRDDSLAGAMAATLHADGFKLAIDDFGSGATSLAKVRELKFEYLKLDGILVKDLAESESDREFVSALAKLAHDIGVKIIAEFVQDEATMEFLAECEIEYAQGYYIGEPEPMPG